MANLTPKEEFNELLSRFNVFTEIENIEKLEHHYMPRIANFSDHLSRYEQSNQEMRECISRFDEDMSLKCSKSTLKTFEHELTKKYLSLDGGRDIQAEIEDAKKLILQQDDRME